MASFSPTDVAIQLPALRRYARVLTRDAVAADDLVQQALVRALERSATFRPDAALKPWLLAIVHNEFVSACRQTTAESRALAGLPRDAAGNGDDLDQAIYLREVAARFARLPAEQRAVLHLVAIEGLSYRQAADALATPVGTIMSRLSRARAALREPVGDDGDGERALRIIGGTDAQ